MNCAKTFTSLPFHPIYLFALALIGGIYAQSAGIFTIFSVGIVTIFAMAQLQFISKKQHIFTFCGIIIFFFLGALRCVQRSEEFYSFFRAVGRGPCKIEARLLDSEPSFREEGVTIATFEIKKIWIDNKIVPVAPLKSRCVVTCRQRLYSEIGDTVTINRLFFRQPPIGSDYECYLIKEGLIGHFKLKAENIVIDSHQKNSFRRIFYTMRNRIVNALKTKLSPETFSLFISIFWGKHAINQRQMEIIRSKFRPWGILHYLARAGLHVSMLVLLLGKALSFLPIPAMFRTLLGAGIITFYTLITWSSISFIRATLVFFLLSLCTFFWLPAHGLYRLTLACILILIINPYQLFFLDFQLSFLVTFIFMWLPALEKAQNS